MKKGSLISYISARLKNNVFDTVIMALFIAFCLGSGVYFLILKQILYFLLPVFFIIVPPAALILEKYSGLKWPSLLLFLFLLIPTGCILGSCYDFYTFIPCFDTVLHTMSGFVFACLGFGLTAKIIGNPKDKRSFAVCLLFGFVFSLAVATVWELFEFACTMAGGTDMQEDSIIYGFGSYLLSGTHKEIFEVNGITQTVIYYENGLTLTINGYLDIGLIDTICDMFVCLIGAVVYLIVIIAARCKCGKLFNLLIPQNTTGHDVRIARADEDVQ